MAVGYPVAAADVNNKAAALAQSVWDSLDQMNRFYKWLTDATHNDAYLNGIGITVAGDITTLRAGISDLGSTTNGLYAVAHGTFAPSGASNYFANAKNLTGTNYTG